MPLSRGMWDTPSPISTGGSRRSTPRPSCRNGAAADPWTHGLSGLHLCRWWLRGAGCGRLFPFDRSGSGGCRRHAALRRTAGPAVQIGGKLVNPAEVEAVLLSHSAVAEARCIRQAHPLLGFVPVAEVVLRDGSSSVVADLREHCRAALESHARPRQIEVRSDFPIAPSGKQAISPH
ncbi:hypothetical protein ACFSHQ_02860 [Gemmobacter lanyuensis]